MIQVIYTGTTDKYLAENPMELTDLVIESLLEKINNSDFIVHSPTCSLSDYLPKEKVMFSVVINVVPKSEPSAR